MYWGFLQIRLESPLVNGHWKRNNVLTTGNCIRHVTVDVRADLAESLSGEKLPRQV